MNKEEILRRSQNSYKKSDPYKNHLSNIGQLIGCAVALVVSTLIFLLQRLVQGEWNFALYATIPLLLSVKSGFVGIKARNRKEIIESIIIGSIAIIFIVIHIVNIFGV